MMIKIGKHYYDVSIAWPLILFVLMLGFMLLLPAVASLRAFFAG
jgi:hypothetical protein